VTQRAPNERVERPQDHADEQQSRENRSGEGADSALERLRELERRSPDGGGAPVSVRQDSGTAP
jgi:hypothetical protein